MKYLAIILIAALTGCASVDYTQYAKAQSDIATARANSDAARYQALASIASKGDTASSVAAVMAIAIGGGQQQSQQQVAAPQRSDALQWASILVPTITQAYAITRNADVAINASNNAMLTSSSTTGAFVSMAGKIQAPVVATPQANVSTVSTSTDSHNSTSTTSTVGDSMSGTGVQGAGSYSTQANPVTTSTSPVVVPDVIQITPVVQVVPVTGAVL